MALARLRRAGIAATAILAASLPAPALAATVPYSVKTLHFDVVIGPASDQHCDVVGDLYKPASATSATPAAAMLTTNGFGGSKNDQAAAAKAAASRGYVVLSYSGLGFGSAAPAPLGSGEPGSGCKITLDDPDYDGKAASQLVSFLGGGKAATDGTTVDYVIHDRTAHDGRHYADDPRLGMIGGSYGGEIQFAAAGIDPRIDTIIPLITWNDLAYSLAPNNAGDDHGVTSYVPGAFKYEWSSLFFADGIITGLEGVKVDPTRMAGCPNFDNRVCAAAIAAGVTGAPNDAMLTFVRHASVESYMQRIRIPTLLMQGQADTLFNLNESIATYDALRARHVPVKLVWQSWGHSHGPAPGEFDLGHPEGNPDGRIIIGWLNHYLKRSGPAPALDFSYFRDWVSYKGDAAPAYARSARYPVGGTRSLYLSGDGTLASDAGAVHAGTRTLLTTAAGAPTSYTETSALDQSLPVTDVPGTTVSFVGAPLPTDTDVVGIPTLDVRLSAPIHSLLGNAGGAPAEAVLFFRLEDIAPNGSVTLTHRLIAPARIALPDNEVHVQLPGIVHRFAKGHRFALVLAGGDAAYRGSIIAAPVSVLTDRANPGVLHIPVIAARSQLPVP